MFKNIDFFSTLGNWKIDIVEVILYKVNLLYGDTRPWWSLMISSIKTLDSPRYLVQDISCFTVYCHDRRFGARSFLYNLACYKSNIELRPNSIIPIKMNLELSVCSYKSVCTQAEENITDKEVGFRFGKLIELSFYHDVESY